MTARSKTKLSADAEPAKRAIFGGKMARRKKYQFGSLFKRGKRRKVWIGRWWELTEGDRGIERIRRSVILGTISEIPTRREADRILAERLCQINSADFRPESSRTLKDYAEKSWLPEVRHTLKYSTQRHYEWVCTVHLYPEFGNMQLREISREMIQRFLFKKSEDHAWKTAKHIRTVFGTLFNSAMLTGLISENPVLKTRMPRRGLPPEKPAIQPDRLRSLLAILPEPAYSIAHLIAITGMRIGEVLALRWRDVDLESGHIRIRQSVYEGRFDEPKSLRSNRAVPLRTFGRNILIALKPENANPDGLVFGTKNGTPLGRRNLLNRQLKPACEKLGLKGANWHWLRHVNATLLDSVGTPLGTTQALLGHSSSDVTRGVYLHSVPTDACEAVDKVEKLIGPNRTQLPNFGKLATSLTQ